MEESTLLDEHAQPKQRPTFLTVLCILTFIVSGWGLVESTIGIFTAESTATKMEQISDEVEEAIDETDDEEAIDFIQVLMGGLQENMTASNLQNSAIGTMIASIFTLVGAFLMWGLNKKGYYVYLVGILITIIVPLLIFSGSIIGGIVAGSAGFSGVLFLVLYGLNLKHME